MQPVVFMVDTISHAYSSVGVARRLERLGYPIEYWGSATSASRPMLERQQFTYRIVDGVWSRYNDETRLPTHLGVLALCVRPDVLLRKFLARRSWMKKVPDALSRSAASLDRLVAAARPAFVIIDPFLLAYYPLLWARGITAVVLCTKPLAIRDPLVPPYDSYLMPPATALGRMLVLGCWQLRRLQDIGYRTLVAACHGLGAYTYFALLREAATRTQFPLRREMVRRWIQPDLRFRSLYEWALWIPEMDLPRRVPLPPDSRVSYVGPSVQPTRCEGDRIEVASRSRYLIYVAVGTARFRWHDNLAFLRKVIDAFRDLPEVSVLISTSDARGTAALGTAPPNVRIVDFAPQLAMLDRADLVITHAGAGTLRECIEKVVPLLAYPRNHDQMGNSARIAFHAIGLRGRREADSPADIRDKAMRILTDARFKENLRRLRTAVHASQDRLLADAVASVVGAPPVVALPPRAAAFR